MASPHRQPAQDLEALKDLRERPHAFGFFSAVRLIECIHADRPRLGDSLRPADDPVRLTQDPSVAFAPATLAGYAPGSGTRPARLASYFLGLFGPQGPLPLHLTEFARARQRNDGDPTIVRFLDVFHHRMLSFFYRAWANVRPTVQYDRPERDRFGTYVGALFGIGRPAFRDLDELPDPAKLHYAGLLACQTHHPDGLQAMIVDFFGLPARIEEFVAAWLALAPGDRWRLGASTQTGTLGKTVILGTRVWDAQHRFRIALGPLSYADYERLLPGGLGLRRLRAVVRNYLGDELAWDVNLILKGEEVPKLALGQTGRLGWTCWLGARAPERDAADLFLDPSAAARGGGGEGERRQEGC